MDDSLLHRLLARLTRFSDAPADIRRRALLQATVLLATAGLAGTHGRRAFAQAKPRFVADPFSLGVASGYPRADGITLWTRLSTSPLEPNGGLVDPEIPVRYEVASDEKFAHVVKSGAVGAFVENAHAVHVDVAGLESNRPYFYRFMAGDYVSPLGRTRTAPAADAKVDRLRFAIGSCQHYEHGWFTPHAHLAAENIDLMLFLGDYIYDNSWGDAPVRKHSGPDAYTLVDYRMRYAQYRADPDLQRMHSLAPWMYAIDDHEVDNDWAGGLSEHLDPQFLVRRAAAFQALWEHQPLPRRMWPTPAEMRTYDRLQYGRLATIHMLDDRQYRSPHPCPDPFKGAGSRTMPEADCPLMSDPSLTMLGDAQHAWLEQGLATKPRWHFLGQQTLMSPLWGDMEGKRSVWTDGWDAYRASRRRILDTMAANGESNHVVLGGDIHATAIADVHHDIEDAKSPIVASEFCGTSLSAQGWKAGEFAARVALNPHIHYGDDQRRGYLLFDVTERGLRCDVRNVDTVRKPKAAIATSASFVVEPGTPGPRRA